MSVKLSNIGPTWRDSLRQQWRTIVLLLLAGVVLWAIAWQVRAPIRLYIGGGYADPFLVKYVSPASNANGSQPDYRWAEAYSVIQLPGVGAGSGVIELQLAAPGSKTLPVQVYVNGAAAGTLNLTGTMSSYAVAVPFYPLLWGGDGASSGDLRLVLQAPPTRHAGINQPVAFQASVATLTWGGLVIPAPFQLLWLAVSLLLVYALLRRLGLSIRWAAYGGLGFVLATALLLIFLRLALTIYTAPLAIVLLITHLALWLAQWLAGLAFRRAGVAISPALGMMLAALFAVGFALKLGGLFHPLSRVIDAEFHMARIREVAQDFWRYYSPPGLALAVMPQTDWKTQVIIPYSPFFYMFARPLTWLPGALNLKVYIVSVFLDAIRVYPVAFIALRFGWSERAATYAAIIAAFTPATFLLQQWGNWPTNFSLIFALLFLAMLVGYWPLLDRRALVWLTLALTFVFLSYTVTAVFLGLTVLGLALLGGIGDRLKRAPSPSTLGFAAPAASFRPTIGLAYAKTVAALLGATILATLLFYGQYIIVLVTETIPNILNTAASNGSLKPTTISWPNYFAISAQTMVSYSLWPIYILGLVGLVVYILREKGSAATFSKALLLSTVMVGLLFVFVNYYVDMAVKQFWWALPILALTGGWLLALINGWQDEAGGGAKRMIGRLLPLLICASFVLDSLTLWIERLFFHNR